MPSIRSEADLDHSRLHARLAAVVSAWADAGLFDELAGTAKSIGNLSGDARALRITARILGNAGILMRRGSRWILSAEGRELHDDGVLGGYRGMEFFKGLGRLDEVLADGGPIPDDDGERSGSTIGVHPDDPERTRQFLKMLERRSVRTAKTTARWIDRRVDTPARILDLGGGHGRYGRELAALDHRVTLFDLPVCVDVARDIHGDELEYIAGDFFADDLGGPYDVVLASNIIHGLSAHQNQRLFERVAPALASGGELVLKDMFLDDFEFWPENAVYFAMVMLLYTDAGETYTIGDVETWFDSAGLVATDPVVFESSSLVSGKRP